MADLNSAARNLVSDQADANTREFNAKQAQLRAQAAAARAAAASAAKATEQWDNNSALTRGLKNSIADGEQARVAAFFNQLSGDKTPDKLTFAELSNKIQKFDPKGDPQKIRNVEDAKKVFEAAKLSEIGQSIKPALTPDLLLGLPTKSAQSPAPANAASYEPWPPSTPLAQGLARALAEKKLSREAAVKAMAIINRLQGVTRTDGLKGLKADLEREKEYLTSDTVKKVINDALMIVAAADGTQYTAQAPASQAPSTTQPAAAPRVAPWPAHTPLAKALVKLPMQPEYEAKVVNRINKLGGHKESLEKLATGLLAYKNSDITVLEKQVAADAGKLVAEAMSIRDKETGKATATVASAPASQATPAVAAPSPRDKLKEAEAEARPAANAVADKTIAAKAEAAARVQAAEQERARAAEAARVAQERDARIEKERQAEAKIRAAAAAKLPAAYEAQEKAASAQAMARAKEIDRLTQEATTKADQEKQARAQEIDRRTAEATLRLAKDTALDNERNGRNVLSESTQKTIDARAKAAEAKAAEEKAAAKAKEDSQKLTADIQRSNAAATRIAQVLNAEANKQREAQAKVETKVAAAVSTPASASTKVAPQAPAPKSVEWPKDSPLAKAMDHVGNTYKFTDADKQKIMQTIGEDQSPKGLKARLKAVSKDIKQDSKLHPDLRNIRAVLAHALNIIATEKAKVGSTATTIPDSTLAPADKPTSGEVIYTLDTESGESLTEAAQAQTPRMLALRNAVREVIGKNAKPRAVLNAVAFGLAKENGIANVDVVTNREIRDISLEAAKEAAKLLKDCNYIDAKGDINPGYVPRVVKELLAKCAGK